jgi:hypothetical protein
MQRSKPRQFAFSSSSGSGTMAYIVLRTVTASGRSLRAFPSDLS